MNTNAALIVPPQSTNTNAAAQLMYHDNAKPLIAISDIWFWVWLAVAIVTLSIIAFILWKYWRKKAAMPAFVPIVPPHMRARRALERALSLISEPKPFTTSVSDTLRIYLEERFNF